MGEYFVHHGLLVLFGAVFFEQLGLPLPAFPWLLAAGALSASGKFNLASGLGTAVIACVLADVLWFFLGRYRGVQVLGLLCRISLEPDSCVRRTRNVFTKYGPRSLVIAKFVPGISTVAPPLAGINRMSLASFVTFDVVGSLLYAGACMAAGYLLSEQIDQLGAAIHQIGGSLTKVILTVIVLYIAWKYWQRRRLFRKLRMARITVAELLGMLDGKTPPIIVDLRSRKELESDPASIPGAIQSGTDEFESRLSGLERHRDIVLYCSCPNEASSARAALRLQRIGFKRVRPLLGGIDAWKKNHPQVNHPANSVNASRASRNAESASVLSP